MSLIKQKNSNKISSDIDDIDDEIIFNIDDTDSLSSAGTTDLIHNSNTNNNSSFKITDSSLSNKIKCNSDTDNIKLKTSNNSKSISCLLRHSSRCYRTIRCALHLRIGIFFYCLVNGVGTSCNT